MQTLADWIYRMAGLGIVMFCGPLGAQEYENLQVLDKNISREALGEVMVANTAGLGLPRRQGEGCLYCHVGDMDTPRNEWDFASDDKRQKRTARAMMAMTMEINEQHLAGLDDRIDPAFTVTCQSCHRGRVDPRPLAEVLESAYDEGGYENLEDRYWKLRRRYYGAGAYNFRPITLVRMTNAMAAGGAYDEAIQIARLNEEANPDDLLAPRARFGLEITRELERDGVEAALDVFDTGRSGERDGVVDTSVLDRIGWRLHRADRVEDALRVFRHNLEQFPAEYVVHASLADGLWFGGDREAGYTVLEAWVSANPDHDSGRRRLLNMQGELD